MAGWSRASGPVSGVAMGVMMPRRGRGRIIGHRRLYLYALQKRACTIEPHEGLLTNCNPLDTCVILNKFPKKTQWEATVRVEVAARTNEEIWHKKQVSTIKRLRSRLNRVPIHSTKRFPFSRRSNSPSSTRPSKC